MFQDDTHVALVFAYARILRNAKAGKGVRLTAREVAAISRDDAIISTVEANRDNMEKYTCAAVAEAIGFCDCASCRDSG